MKAPPEPPTIRSLSDRIEELVHQSGTILFLSAVNMIMNVLTIAFGFLITMD